MATYFVRCFTTPLAHRLQQTSQDAGEPGTEQPVRSDLTTAQQKASTMFTTRLTFVLASSLLLAPALAFGAVPACVDMDAPSFSMLMDQLAAQNPSWSDAGFQERFRTCASAAGICCASTQVASACPVTCDACATDLNKPSGLQCEPPASVAARAASR